MLPDPDRITEIITETAAQDILPRFQALASHEVMEKRPGDLVTVADLDAEKQLERRLTELVSGSVVVGEEAVHGDTTILDRLESKSPMWIIDPVDGTANFAAGNPIFGTVVAYLEAGDVRAGWIHMPVEGTTAVAVKGEGAWRDGTMLSAVPSVPLEEMTGLLNFGYFDPLQREQIRERSGRFASIETQRCAAHDYLCLAIGTRHFSLYRRLWPWDHAAGVLIHQEAGGYSALLDGSPYRPTERSHGLLSARSKRSWYEIHDHLLAD